MKIWVYRTIEIATGRIIKEGILDDCFDIDIEQLTELDDNCDRCLWEVQKYLNEHYKNIGYEFEYVETEFDIDEVLEH